MELTIEGKVYQFKASFGFYRHINGLKKEKVEGTGQEKEIGLSYYFALVFDGDIEALVTVLDALNIGMDPRVTRAELEAHIEDVNTDIDALFDAVIDFLLTSNVTKRETRNVLKRAGLLEAYEKTKKQKK